MISVAPREPQVPTQSPPPQQPAPSEAETATVFRSRLPDIPLSNHLPLHTYCFERMHRFPDSPCLLLGPSGDSFSYADTHLLCLRAAAGLSRLGVRQGDVIMVLLQNSPEFVFSFLGASMIGAVTTSANPYCNPSEIYKQFKASGAVLVVTQPLYIDKLRSDPFPNDLVIITAGGETEISDGCIPFSDLIGGAESTIDALPDVAISPDDAVALPYSSGTTGLPKGVVLTHRSLTSSVAQQVDGENPNLYLKAGEDVMLCVLPLFHIFSLNSVLLCALRRGAAVALMPRFEIAAMMEVIETRRVTVAAVVPPLVLAMAKSAEVERHDLSSVRLVLSGAAPLGKELEDALRGRLPQAVFGQGYGMTEAGPVLSMCPAFAKQPSPSKSGSCGTVVRNAELKVIDTETGFSLGRNQPGEICIRGPQIMKGYSNDPEATSMTIDIGGWLHTGDIGYVDDDDEVFIVDRVKELIKFKGFQVPPAELEALLISHLSIADAAVVPQKDEVAGEVPVAFVVRSKDSDITEEAVKEFIAKQVVFYKRLHKVYFVQAIPKSPSGKILRKDLRARLVNS